MGTRLELQAELENVLGSGNVYFQPPASIKMSYPAIVYSLERDTHLNANDKLYYLKKRYTLTVIDKNPDTTIPDSLILAFQYCSFDRHYKADNLNHYVLTIYY